MASPPRRRTATCKSSVSASIATVELVGLPEGFDISFSGLEVSVNQGGQVGTQVGSTAFVKWGASPRAAQALIRAARVRALAEGRAHVAFEDIRHFASEVLGHRMLLNYDGQAEGIQVGALVRKAVETLPEQAA